MQKLTTLTLLSLLIFSCSTEPEEVTVSPDLEDSIEVPKELVFNTIEDYAQVTTKAQLIKTFGKENITNGTSWYAEGTIQLKHSIVTNPKNKHIVKYLWDEGNPKKMSSIEISYFDYTEDYEIKGTQKVLSACGFYTGMPINDLRKWNGADFTFSGFGWDHEGDVTVKPKSRLNACRTAIKLGLKHDGNLDLAEGLYGDQELSTSNEAVKKAPIIIDRLYYYLED